MPADPATLGVHDARAAARLAGLPRSTVYDWARRGWVRPAVTGPELRWSPDDVMALRLVAWLRRPPHRRPVRAAAIDRAARWLAAHDERWWRGGTTPIRLDGRGRLHAVAAGGVVALDGQGVLTGVDLRAPDPGGPTGGTVRPGRCGSEPVVGSRRLPAVHLERLAARGAGPAVVAELYPHAPGAAAC